MRGLLSSLAGGFAGGDSEAIKYKLDELREQKRAEAEQLRQENLARFQHDLALSRDAQNFEQQQQLSTQQRDFESGMAVYRDSAAQNQQAIESQGRQALQVQADDAALARTHAAGKYDVDVARIKDGVDPGKEGWTLGKPKTFVDGLGNETQVDTFVDDRGRTMYSDPATGRVIISDPAEMEARALASNQSPAQSAASATAVSEESRRKLAERLGATKQRLESQKSAGSSEAAPRPSLVETVEADKRAAFAARGASPPADPVDPRTRLIPQGEGKPLQGQPAPKLAQANPELVQKAWVYLQGASDFPPQVREALRAQLPQNYSIKIPESPQERAKFYTEAARALQQLRALNAQGALY